MSYRAPISDMMFLLKDVFNIQATYQSIPRFKDFDYDLYSAVLEESHKFNSQVLHPMNRSGDEEGCQFNNGQVKTPEGFIAAYQQYCEGGWSSLNADEAQGGQGLPKPIHVCFEEMLYACNTSFALYSVLTAAACHTIDRYAPDDLKQHYLPHLISGRWCGTMCLTESHCGSDLGLIKTKAEPADNQTYRLTGSKIFVTGGEHDLTENIIHLILARLPGAPEGPKGLSMFLVPKFMLDKDGKLTSRNAIECGSIEHKMGIKGSATCVMNLDNALGYLIGPENKGLNCMFTMMNKARLSIGLQGIGLAEMAYQLARDYAIDRKQGKSNKHQEAPVAIIEHADVRRMLLTMRTLTEANRALALYLSFQMDVEEHHPDETLQQKASQRVALLIPVAKAFFTDSGFESCNHGLQVFGGHGYIREWGIEQLVRDARIAQIYEGSNGIQAQDFLMRKVCMNHGDSFNDLLNDIQSSIQQAMSHSEYDVLAAQLSEKLKQIQQMSEQLIQDYQSDASLVQAGAVEFLHATAYCVHGWLWLNMLMNQQNLPTEEAERKYCAADFFFNHLLPRVDSLILSIKNSYTHSFHAKVDSI